MPDAASPASANGQTGTSSLRDRRLNLLYVSGSAPDIDLAATQLLAGLANDVRITTIPGTSHAAAAVTGATGDATFHALFLSPTLREVDVLDFIATSRRGRAPVAILPVVNESHHGLCTSAVAAGADGVILLLDGRVVSADETLRCIWDSPHCPTDPRPDPPARSGSAPRGRGFGRLQALFRGPKSDKRPPGHDPTEPRAVPDAGRLRVRAVLNEVHVARVRTESELGVERPGETSEAMPAPSVEQKPPDRRRDRITRKRFDDALAESLSWRQQLNDARVAHELDRAGWETARRALEGQLASSRSALEEATRRLESDRRDFEGRGQALLARIAELETATGTGTEVQAVLDETRRQLQATSDELGEARSMRDAARRDLEALGRELDAASARSKEVEGELAGVTREKQALETALGDARVEAARAGEVARVQLTESEASRQNLEREVKRLRSAAAAHRDLEAQLAAARAELRGAAQRHDAAGAAWDAERQRIERTLETEAAHIITAAAARTDLEDRLATVTTRKNALEAVLSELAGRVDRLAEESSALREQLRAVSTPDGRPLQPKQ